MHRQPLTDEQVREAARQYERGHSLARVAQSLGTGPSTVARALREAGLAIRPRGGRRSPTVVALWPIVDKDPGVTSSQAWQL
ncbi:MAG: helix-turn-helix domain-containing protein [Nostocoides sp.]